MINFYSETDFKLEQEDQVSVWISNIITNEGFDEGEISYIFCDDKYLHKLNVDFLNHDTFTDIISFDNSLGKQINGDIYISVERVHENATIYKTTFKNELHRVIVHGILHFCGFKDKTELDAKIMRTKEDESLLVRNFI
jgi:rRNA maturation RNase YbeY